MYLVQNSHQIHGQVTLVSKYDMTDFLLAFVARLHIHGNSNMPPPIHNFQTTKYIFYTTDNF
jgi:hypothetical protein